MNAGLKDDSEFIENARYGIGKYIGRMLPKEKKFIERLFEQEIIDTVVGTDALALGVNFPIENVVFAQIRKNDDSISRNMFDQLAGRAGRKAFFDTGHVYYSDIIEDELIDANERRNRYLHATGQAEESYVELDLLYSELLMRDNEDIEIRLTPRVKDILLDRCTIEQEAEYISKFSVPRRDEAKVGNMIIDTVEMIEDYDVLRHKLNREHDDEFRYEYNNRRYLHRNDEDTWFFNETCDGYSRNGVLEAEWDKIETDESYDSYRTIAM